MKYKSSTIAVIFFLTTLLSCQNNDDLESKTKNESEMGSVNTLLGEDDLEPKTKNESKLGLIGTIFARSLSNDNYYAFQPYSMTSSGRLYEFSSLTDMVDQLPTVGVPVYWLNYTNSHRDLFRVDGIEPLSESDLLEIESTCTGGFRSFPREEHENHPALPIRLFQP